MMKTVALQLTGHGMAAIAVLLIAGERAAEIVEKIARGRRVTGMTVGQAVHCALLKTGAESTGEEVLDDAVVVRVGEQRYELHVHGGAAVVRAVMATLSAAGAEVVDLAAAEARGIFGAGIAGEVAVALPLARTMTGARLLAGQIEGGLTAFAREWAAWLTAAGRGENDLWRMQSAVQWILVRSEALLGLIDPPRVAIVGPPNAGKSTLANALLGRPVSITSDIAGTTRDWVDGEGQFSVASGQGSAVSGEERAGLATDHWPLTTVPVLLVDTAGVRETADAIEVESIARTHQQARGADVVVVVLDATRIVGAADMALVEKYRGAGATGSGRVVVAVNKIDIAGEAGRAAALRLGGVEAVAISAQRGDGLAELMEAVLAALDLGEVATDEPFAFSRRQRELLAQLALTGDTRRADELLAELLGGSA